MHPLLLLQQQQQFPAELQRHLKMVIGAIPMDGEASE